MSCRDGTALCGGTEEPSTWLLRNVEVWKGSWSALGCSGAGVEVRRRWGVENEGPLGSCPQGCRVGMFPLPSVSRPRQTSFASVSPTPMAYSSTRPGGGARGQG